MIEKVIEEDTIPRWEDLMPRYFEILARKPVVNADQSLLDLVKAECMRAARVMDDLVEAEDINHPAELTSACCADLVTDFLNPKS